MDTTTEKNYLAEVTHQLKQKITEVEAALTPMKTIIKR